MRAFPVVLALFIGIPIVEVYLLIQIGGAIGALPTIALVVLTAVLGAGLLRTQGVSTLRRAQANLDRGELPAFELVEGVALLVGGALLLTPGFFTDAVGFVCLLPPTRRALIAVLWPHIRALRAVRGDSTSAPDNGPASRGTDEHKRRGRVIEGEYTEADRTEKD